MACTRPIQRMMN